MQSNHKMYAFCWTYKTLKVSVAILNSIRKETSSQLSLGGGGVKTCEFNNYR